jgi:antitoxin component of MazEF toxin-antitoxin module
MIALKVEKIGDRVAVVLTEDALAALHLAVGDTLQLEPSGDGAFHAVTREGWAEDPHARGGVPAALQPQLQPDLTPRPPPAAA